LPHVPDIRLTGDVPSQRIRAATWASVNPSGKYVLYWMIAQRRSEWNFALQRAVDWARELRKPLIVLEALRCDYQWASDRLHRFVIQGMSDNARRLERKSATYYPYVEPRPGAGRGLLEELARNACLVLTDEYPCFFLPRMVARAAQRLSVPLEVVDSNGLLPLRVANKVFARAFDFRRFLQRELKPHLADVPRADPLSRVRLPRLGALPSSATRRWPATNVVAMANDPKAFANLPIDHSVAGAPAIGGADAAQGRWQSFLRKQLTDYRDNRNEPHAEATSNLSPYLHFGHISPHQILSDLMQHEQWSPNRLATKATGKSSGWWGISPSAEAFLDQLITWRELGFNMCSQRDDYDQYESLPTWAQMTLAKHSKDRRKHTYTLEEFAAADTHDALWNAAQRQLTSEGRIHNYLRMLWGKKILEWSSSAEEALDIMITLNNRFALDGRDPNSYSGIFWILGRYDRAWGPERPIFGKIRYMSSANTARKLSVKSYLARFGPEK
jgi:deoxyribodipyrimidine photo-lyase